MQVRRTSNPVVLGRKFCAGCGRWRPVHDFARYRSGSPRPRCGCCERLRARWKRTHTTPEQLERKREYQRIWCEAQRRKQGIPERECDRRSAVDQIERVFLDPQPIIEVVDRYLERHRRVGIELTWEEVARHAGVADRTLRRLWSGESQRVRLDVADKLAVSLGSALSLLYPP